MVKNLFSKSYKCVITSLILIVVSTTVGMFYGQQTGGRNKTSLDTHDVLSSVYMPYSYKDSAYDLGVKGCDNPGCVELGAGFTQGDYDKANEDFIQIIGQIDTKNTEPDTKRQLRFICSYIAEKYTCRTTTIVIAKEIVDDKAVASLDYYLGTESDLQIVSTTKDVLIARSHFQQSAGGNEYRLDRKNRKLTVVYYKDGKVKGDVIYPSGAPVETLIEK